MSDNYISDEELKAMYERSPAGYKPSNYNEVQRYLAEGDENE